MKLLNILVGIMVSGVFTTCLRAIVIPQGDVVVYVACKSKTTGAVSRVPGVCPPGTVMVDEAGNPTQTLN
jgi:hypothetical protein